MISSDDNDSDTIPDNEDTDLRRVAMYGTRRSTIRGESFDPKKYLNHQHVVHKKSEEEKARIAAICKGLLMFRGMDSNDMNDIIDAMVDKKVKTDEEIIRQGDKGDHFYVIEKGCYEAWIERDGVKTMVHFYDNYGYFGELALMYNAPRAATVIAKDKGILCALDRETFHAIVLKSSHECCEMYEYLLKSVPILQGLSQNQMMNLAYALNTETFVNGDIIIKQGDEGKSMYFIEEGKVQITYNDDKTNQEMDVIVLEKGKYFGELALITSRPRAANAYAIGITKLAVLERDCFERLLGRCIDLMTKKTDEYEEQLDKLRNSVLC